MFATEEFPRLYASATERVAAWLLRSQSLYLERDLIIKLLSTIISDLCPYCSAEASLQDLTYLTQLSKKTVPTSRADLGQYMLQFCMHAIGRLEEVNRIQFSQFNVIFGHISNIPGKSDWVMLTLRMLQHPWLFKLWRHFLFDTEDFDLENFCIQFAELITLHEAGFQKPDLVRLFQMPVPDAKILCHLEFWNCYPWHYNSKGHLVREGYEAWWHMQLASCNLEVMITDRQPWNTHYCSCAMTKLTYSLHSSGTLVVSNRWGPWPSQHERIVFRDQSKNKRRTNEIQRYDFLVRIWPSKKNNRKPLFMWSRSKDYMIVCLRRWEWCAAILMRVT